MPAEKPCVWNGRRYPSLSIAADFCGVSEGAMRQRLAQGHTNDMSLYNASNQAKPTTYAGTVYPSIRAAAKAAGVSKTTLRLYLARDQVE